MAGSYLVYIFRCSDKSYYVGSTHDIDDRLTRHNAGRAATYTAIRRQVTLVYTEEHPNQLAATLCANICETAFPAIISV